MAIVFKMWAATRLHLFGEMPQVYPVFPFHQILLPHDKNESKVNLVQAASEMGQCEKHGLKMGSGF